MYTGRAIVWSHDKDNKFFAQGYLPWWRAGYADVLLSPNNAGCFLLIGLDAWMEASTLLSTSLVLGRCSGKQFNLLLAQRSLESSIERVLSGGELVHQVPGVTPDGKVGVDGEIRGSSAELLLRGVVGGRVPVYRPGG